MSRPTGSSQADRCPGGSPVELSGIADGGPRD